MEDAPKPSPDLRKGWTTGSCATAAATAALAGLVTGECLDPVPITLPGGQRPSFSLARSALGPDWAFAAVVKDAGDDPDVTHQALICARLWRGAPGSGIQFRAGEGVGTVTRPGLPLPVGEPAINPVPRQMMQENLGALAASLGIAADLVVEISIPGGQHLAQRTLNPRLGIVGGLSILGTTGIVVPFSCAAWIHSIHRGIDVARASGLPHIAGATGNTSEASIQRRHGLPEPALIEMGDFAGGMLKYLRRHPVPRVSIAGGFAKMTKLAQGLLDLHSRAGAVDLVFLAQLAAEAGAAPALCRAIAGANTAKHALDLAEQLGPALAARVAEQAWQHAAQVMAGSGVALEILVVDREGAPLASQPFKTC